MPFWINNQQVTREAFNSFLHSLEENLALPQAQIRQMATDGRITTEEYVSSFDTNCDGQTTLKELTENRRLRNLPLFNSIMDLTARYNFRLIANATDPERVSEASPTPNDLDNPLWVLYQLRHGHPEFYDQASERVRCSPPVVNAIIFASPIAVLRLPESFRHQTESFKSSLRLAISRARATNDTAAFRQIFCFILDDIGLRISSEMIAESIHHFPELAHSMIEAHTAFGRDPEFSSGPFWERVLRRHPEDYQYSPDRIRQNDLQLARLAITLNPNNLRHAPLGVYYLHGIDGELNSKTMSVIDQYVHERNENFELLPETIRSHLQLIEYLNVAEPKALVSIDPERLSEDFIEALAWTNINALGNLLQRHPNSQPRIQRVWQRIFDACQRENHLPDMEPYRDYQGFINAIGSYLPVLSRLRSPENTLALLHNMDSFERNPTGNTRESIVVIQSPSDYNEGFEDDRNYLDNLMREHPQYRLLYFSATSAEDVDRIQERVRRRTNRGIRFTMINGHGTENLIEMYSSENPRDYQALETHHLRQGRVRFSPYMASGGYVFFGACLAGNNLARVASERNPNVTFVGFSDSGYPTRIRLVDNNRLVVEANGHDHQPMRILAYRNGRLVPFP